MNKFGIIKLKIQELMCEKDVSRKYILEKTGLKNEVFNRYYYNEIKKIDIVILTKIRYVLECNVTDVIEYEKSK